MSHYVLNAQHLICPLPVIRTQQRIEHLDDGDTLLVVATDPGALHDIPAWCRVHGHLVTGREESDSGISINIRICKP